MANTTESSKWLEEHQRNARILTASALSMWLGCSYKKHLRWKQFYQIFATQCTWAIHATRMTDFCDHCQLWNASIQPGLRKFLHEAKAQLTQHLPAYFSAQPNMSESASVVEQAHALLKYVESHSEKQRDLRTSMTRKARLSLHDMEAKVEHQLKWEISVADSYAWHKSTADRQTCAVFEERNNIQLQHGLVWLDFKQNITLPLATVQTSSMFYGPSRQELACMGVVLFDGTGGKVTQKNLLFLSEIIDHTSLVVGEYFKEAMQAFRAPHALNHLSCWFDCGGHFRSYDHAGFLIKEIFQKYRCGMTISYFAERHGKGLVDGCFGMLQSWIDTYLKQENKVIGSLDELLSVCQTAAAHTSARDPEGIQWEVRKFDSPEKPSSHWTLCDPPFKIQSTYCLDVKPYAGHNYDRPLLVNRVFSDVPTSSQSKHVAFCAEKSVADSEKQWRRGYFGNRNWDKQKPERGQHNTLMKKHAQHKALGLPAPVLSSNWQDRAARQARRLEARRQKWRRMADGSDEEPQSDSSSSSTESSSDSST